MTRFPWINYDNFVKTEFRTYLEARKRIGTVTGRAPSKAQVTSTSRVETSIIDAYVKQREQQAAAAQPILPPLMDSSAISAVSCDAGDCRVYLIQQRCHLRGIPNVVPGQGRGYDHSGVGIHSQV